MPVSAYRFFSCSAFIPHEKGKNQKLWKLLIDKNLKKKDLQKMAGISSSSIAKLGRNENVNTEIINKICNALDCDTSDIMEMESEEA